MTTDYPKKPRPTTYRGTKMRSRLEAGYAQWLDRSSLTWEYEPQAFGSRSGQYLPDFRIADLMIAEKDNRDPEPKVAYVEVKHAGWIEPPEEAEDQWRKWRAEMDELMFRMGTILESEPDALLILERPGITCRVDIFDFERGCEAVEMIWAYSHSPQGGPPWIWLEDPPELFEPPWYGEWWKR